MVWEDCLFIGTGNRTQDQAPSPAEVYLSPCILLRKTVVPCLYDPNSMASWPSDMSLRGFIVSWSRPVPPAHTWNSSTLECWLPTVHASLSFWPDHLSILAHKSIKQLGPKGDRHLSLGHLKPLHTWAFPLHYGPTAKPFPETTRFLFRLSHIACGWFCLLWSPDAPAPPQPPFAFCILHARPLCHLLPESSNSLNLVSVLKTSVVLPFHSHDDKWQDVGLFYVARVSPSWKDALQSWECSGIFKRKFLIGWLDIHQLLAESVTLYTQRGGGYAHILSGGPELPTLCGFASCTHSVWPVAFCLLLSLVLISGGLCLHCAAPLPQLIRQSYMNQR